MTTMYVPLWLIGVAVFAMVAGGMTMILLSLPAPNRTCELYSNDPAVRRFLVGGPDIEFPDAAIYHPLIPRLGDPDGPPRRVVAVRAEPIEPRNWIVTVTYGPTC